MSDNGKTFVDNNDKCMSFRYQTKICNFLWASGCKRVFNKFLISTITTTSDD